MMRFTNIVSAFLVLLFHDMDEKYMVFKYF